MTDEQLRRWLDLPVLDEPDHEVKLEHVERVHTSDNLPPIYAHNVAAAIKLGSNHVWELIDELKAQVDAGEVLRRLDSDPLTVDRIRGNLTLSRIAFDWRLVERHGQTFMHVSATVGVSAQESVKPALGDEENWIAAGAPGPRPKESSL